MQATCFFCTAQTAFILSVSKSGTPHKSVRFAKVFNSWLIIVVVVSVPLVVLFTCFAISYLEMAESTCDEEG